MLRNKIDNKFKWELSDVIKNDAEIQKIFEKIENLSKIYPKYDGKLGNKSKLLEFLSKYEQDELDIERLYFYLSNLSNIDISDTKTIELTQKFTNLYTKLLSSSAFFIPQMSELSDKYLMDCINDKKFKNYHNTLKEIIKNKPHKLDEKTTKLLTKMSKFLGENSEIHSILTNSEMEFEDAVDSKGKKYKLDSTNYTKLLRSTDRNLRETAFNNKMNGYAKLNKTFAELYTKNIELNKFNAEIKNFNSILEKELFDDDIPKSVFDNLIKNINKFIPILQKYVKFQGKVSKIKNFSYFDLFEDKKINGKYSVEKAKEIMLSALSPLGNEYLELVNKKINDNSIDYMPHKDKRSGAYCSDCFACKTLILTNFNHDFDSVSTLLHEMGHCINAEFYNKYQVRENAGITIFAAEIASTVNEILLSQYMLSTCKESEKSYYLHDFLEGVRSTIFRQTLFSEFEKIVHEQIELEKPITYKDLNKIYDDLNKKYYGKSCILPKTLQYEWARIPHFYSDYYVFTYATGMVTAISLASKILNEPGFSEKYIYFLKNGTNKPAVEILNEIGVDLTSSEPYDTAFEFIQKQLNLYISLNK